MKTHNRINRHHRDFRTTLRHMGVMSSLVLLMLTACAVDDVTDNTTPTSNGQNSDKLTLQLRLTLPSSTASATRALNHTQEIGTDAENWIDINDGDYKLIIFNEDGSLLTDDVPVLSFQQEPSYSNNTKYTITGEIDLRTAADKKLENFYVMVLANWQGFDGTSYPSFIGKNITKNDANDIYANGTEYNFDVPNHLTPAATWAPSIAKRKAIPMFGLSGLLSVDNAVENWLFAKDDIPMLRSIAKVELVDNMLSGAITNVTLSRSNANGRFIPDVETNSSWNDDTQITTPSLPSSVIDMENLAFFSERRVIDNEEKTVWIAYIPEMYLSSQQTGKVRPHFNVVVNGRRTHEVKFDNYYDGKVNMADQLTSVLRNHIYRYTITGTTASLELNLSVQPWNMEWDEDEWHFDTPTVPEGKWLTWTTTTIDDDGATIENGYTDKPSELRLLMKAGTSDYAEATFTLSAPLKAKWMAQLVSLQGETDAFYFDGPDNGIIDGNPITLHIKNTREIVAEKNNEARLVIMVEYPDKTQKEAIVVDPQYINATNGKNYTIVQQLTEIMQ